MKCWQNQQNQQNNFYFWNEEWNNNLNLEENARI